jgi:hypothetical protein
MKKSYKIKVGKNQWKVFQWSETHNIYIEGYNILTYNQACEFVKSNNLFMNVWKKILQGGK